MDSGMQTGFHSHPTPQSLRKETRWAVRGSPENGDQDLGHAWFLDEAYNPSHHS